MSARSWRCRRGSFLSLAAAWAVASFWAAAPAADTAAAEAAALAKDAVREALQREVYGLDGDRQDLLKAAISTAPDYAPARWHQGFVRTASGWHQAASAADKKRLALLGEYEKMRAAMGDTVAGQFALADWCVAHGLREQERAHLLRVCDLVNDHPQARQRLQHVRINGEWVSREERERQQQLSAAAVRAEQYWRPIVEKLAANLASGISARREQAVKYLLSIQDPAALPLLQSVIATRGEEAELLVVTATAQMTDERAAAALARHAVFSSSLNVRKTAAGHLKNCERDRYVPLLISAMYTPVISRMATVALPNGRIGYRHEFLREGAEQQEHLILDTEYRRVASPNGDAMASARTALRDAARTARNLEQAAAQQNAATLALNDRIVWVLNEATGEGLPAQPDDWWKWWNDENEVFVEGTKQVATITQTRRVAIVEQDPVTGIGNSTSSATPIPARQDCLAAGTPVWTERGQIAIEQLRVGDLVLSRDVESGELAFKPVLRTTVRPAGQLLKITAGRETFETSGGHLFWVSGEGWVKSRKLETGMVLHTAAGPSRVTSVEDGQTAVTYNLVVADFNTYFVGQQKLLSHDNTVRRATSVTVPGLRME